MSSSSCLSLCSSRISANSLKRHRSQVQSCLQNRTWVHLHMHVCAHEYMHAYVRACVGMHTCVDMHTWVYLLERPCEHACVHTNTHACIHASNACVCARKNMYACIHASCICAFMQIFIHAYVRHIHMCIHANMQTCIHAFMQTCLHTCINLQVCMRTCVHLYMQSCLHTCMMREMWCLVWWERERERESVMQRKNDFTETILSPLTPDSFALSRSHQTSSFSLSLSPSTNLIPSLLLESRFSLFLSHSLSLGTSDFIVIYHRITF